MKVAAISSRFLVVLVVLCVLLLSLSASALAAGGQVSPTNPMFKQWMTAETSEQLRIQALGLGMPLGFAPTPQDMSFTRGMRVQDAPLGALPSKYDLRTYGKVSSVKDQNPYGTCWTFASYGSLESNLLPSNSYNFAEDNMALTHGFDYVIDYNHPTKYDRGGNYTMATAYLARWSWNYSDGGTVQSRGPVYETDDRYADFTTPSGLSPRKHVQEVYWLPERSSSTDNTAIKTAIQKYGAVAVAFDWQNSSSYYKSSTKAYYYNRPYNGSDPTTWQNHAVLIVGWDDTYAASNFALNPGHPGAFIVKNSWGTSWGASGYFYISYYDTTLATQSNPAVFINAESTSNYSKIYQYDPLGAVYGWGSGTNGVPWWGANVFTASSTSSLRAVGIYTFTPGSSYEIWAGKSLSSLAKRVSGTQTYMGYHTVKLPTPMAVTSGQKFVVAVKITSPGYGYPIAIEYPASGRAADRATAAAGQSYESSNGSSWTDVTTETWAGSGMARTNVCIKAYTGTVPAPTVTSLSPAYGLAGGGNTVTINGTNLTGATVVKFGTTSATNVSVVSSTKVTCKAPAGAVGKVDVTVKTPGGTSSTSGSGNDYYYANLYQQTDTHLKYSGTWKTVYDSAASGGSYRMTNALNARLDVRFFGTRIYYLATLGPSFRTASISVDGGTPVTVSLYSATKQSKKCVWVSNVLSKAVHTVRITNLSTTGKYIDADAFYIAGTLYTAP